MDTGICEWLVSNKQALSAVLSNPSSRNQDRMMPQREDAGNHSGIRSSPAILKDSKVHRLVQVLSSGIYVGQ